MIKLRPLLLSDLDKYKHWKLPHHEYHAFNGPYFKLETKEEIEKYIEKLKRDLQNNQALTNKKIVSNEKNEIIGEVSWYWRSQETNWLEIGIVIFDSTFWNKVIGCQALNLWIQEIFGLKKEIVRLGISTWSGNIGMIKLAKKVGMKKEAEYRNARIIKGQYFDAVSYGILKTEWFLSRD